MKQRDCVLMHTLAVAKELNIAIEGKDVKSVTDKAFQQAVADRVTKDIIAGTCEMKNLKQDPKELRRYVVGLVNDSFRKDKRLNGGVRYEFKAPGSRAGVGDEVVKTLRAYLGTCKDADQRSAIQAEIDSRLAEIKPKAKQVDLSVLPADVLERLNIQL